uniref:NADH-ubiquinone oxidoreductase chain 4L n=1 Tax=Megalophaedusa ducalis TaxID=1885745 RepID=A0A224AAR4_9EUPU|nr:NADH dehydrogenase subunit 4L [Megalophaedusa ducalis]
MLLLYLLLLLLLLLASLFFSKKNHYLNMLIILEVMMMISLIVMLFILNVSFHNLSVFTLLLTLAVCEAGLGLSLLVTLVKITGSDYISSFPQIS